MRHRVMMVCCALLVFCGFSAGAPVQRWFDQANTFYEQQQFDSARVYYERIIESGIENSAVYYNLGNTSFRRADLGQAILYYSRAQRLAPTDPDIRHNLRFARANIVDRTPQPQKTLVERALEAFHLLLPLKAQLRLFTILLFVLAAMFSLGLFVSHNARLWLIYGGVLITAVLGAVSVSAGIKVYQAETVSHAVVLDDSVTARNAPDGEKVLFRAHEGTTFRIQQKRDEWWFVSLPNGVSGWVEASALAVI